MNQTQIFVAVVVSIVFLGLVVYLLRHRLTKINFDFFKGLIKFGGEACATVSVSQDAIDTFKVKTPFPDQYMSHAVLHILQVKLHKTRGHHAILEETTENYHAAGTLYGQIHGDIIGTCFFESPDYGEHE